MTGTGILSAVVLGGGILFLSLSHSADDTKALPDGEVDRVLAVSNDIGYGEYLAGECSSCHSINQVAGSNVPKIHGVPAKSLVQALLEYRAKIRENTTMGNVAGALGDEEIAVLAHYLEQWTP